MIARSRTIEGTIRSFVATKKQSEILMLRTEIVHEVKQQLDNTLEGWGYHLIDLQLNEAIRHFAEHGKGNTISLDGSSDSMKRTMQELMSISKVSAIINNEEQKAL